ncbi:MAG TPA: SDR family NAD(P)-dependent oxidoreductase, partial [Terriglobia bacterium]|nr:SDR family NAD(P)-dependent oxidoreductase [Terriglobia bacterium]
QSFKDRKVLIAGGTGGLGRAVSLTFLSQLARVFVTYRADSEFAALKHAAGASSTSLEGHQVDVTNETAVRRFVEKLASNNGRIDVLINTIGAYAAGPPLWEMEPKIFAEMLALNLSTGYFLTRAVVPIMLKQRSGAIVNVAARAAFDHTAGAAAYAASKAAAVAMMDSLAADLKGTGVRVNSVLPSIIDTEANRTAMPGADFAKWPKPEDIARVILFLSSGEAKVIHGASIPVYGEQ